ncbi:MAG: lysine--tRNA ligase [Candidatus Sericytochromatia bacterium]|nr:lysine--tRNA ligase [Candidatus Sericytochromatia bacterium]
MDENHSEQELVRRNKLKELKEKNINPYPSKTNRTTIISTLIEKYKDLASGEEIQETFEITGRVYAWRTGGKVSFVDVRDESGKMQLFVSSGKIGQEVYDDLKLFDIGDIISASGNIKKTNRGELSLNTEKITLLSKSLRPLPEKYHGLTDKEMIYRKRYLDLIMNDESRNLFKKRSMFIKEMRNFMDEQGFMEVETPVLELIPGGADARPFTTHHNTLDLDLFLRISLELHLKRLIVGGYEKVFEIGRVFRNEGMSTQHLQEFTLMEFYWAYSDYNDLMDMVEKLYTTIMEKVFGTLKFEYQGDVLDFTSPWARIDYREVILEKAGIDLDHYPTLESLVPVLKEKGLVPDTKLGRGRLIDQLFKKFVRPQLVQPSFLINHPLDISPLAKKQEDNQGYVQRFQVLFAGAEVGNGFTELNDPIDQKSRFAEQSSLRDNGDDEAQMTDDDFIEALEYGMPPTSGFGVGIDRFFSILMNSETIRDVVFFPTMKPLG